MSWLPPPGNAGSPPSGDRPEHARLRSLYDAGLAIPASGREAWLLDQAIPEVQRDLLRRLLATGAQPGYLETPMIERALQIGGELDDDDNHALIGQCIGNFRLTRLLGRGGMATVFLGEREGSDFRQQVAVKLLSRGLFSELEQRLFQRERRALAALSHPNIARLIDGGVTAAGIPYLVMEYVDGVSIVSHATEHRLGVRDRLRLVIDVCAAVTSAHQRLIVHRDIKPSNILVDVQGEVKLLDFGIAKLLDDDIDAATHTGLPVLTPGYAAPEQYAGGAIATTTDVYALGVLLHELLVGDRPADPPRRPSTRITQRSVDTTGMPSAVPALRAALGGDLDNIVLKALAAEPDRRYPTARELADDIRRHLEGRPVAAHPPSTWYRARKFAVRHRGGVVVSAVLVAGLLASLGVALWQATLAREQAQRAIEVQLFVEDLFQPLEQGSPLAGAPSLPELLRRGRERIDQRHPDNPGVRADLLAMFARIGDSIGETADNEALAEAAWRANATAYGQDHERTLEARSLHARVLRKLGNYPEALAQFESVRASMQARGIGGQVYARLLDSMSMVLMEQGIDPQRAISLKLEALQLREADPRASPDDLSAGYSNLGAAYQYAGDYTHALHWYAKALALDRSHSGDSRDTATTLMNIGQVQSMAGRWVEGTASLREARSMFARIPIERHPSLVSLLIRLCGVETDLEAAAADSTCAAALDMAREVHGASHPQYALALTRAARVDLLRGRNDAADAAFAHARAVVIAGGGEKQRLLGIIDAAQARAWWLAGDFERLRKAMLGWLDHHPTSVGRVTALAMAALACRHAPAPECATSLVEEAEVALADPTLAQGLQRLLPRLALAEIAWLDDRPIPAIRATEAVLADVEPGLGDDHSIIVQARLLLAALHAQAGDSPATDQHSRHADAGLAGLPSTHPLRRHPSMYAPRP